MLKKSTVCCDALLSAGLALFIVGLYKLDLAGSQQLMQSFALSLARNGYLAVTFDYYGHGRHPQPLRGDVAKIGGATQKLLKQTRAIAAQTRWFLAAAAAIAVLYPLVGRLMTWLGL